VPYEDIPNAWWREKSSLLQKGGFSFGGIFPAKQNISSLRPRRLGGENPILDRYVLTENLK